MFKKLLSLIYSRKKSGSRIVTTILGIKVKTYNVKSDLYLESGNLNKNIVQMLYVYLNNCAEDDLFCLRTGHLLFIISKGCLKLDYKFFKDYIITQNMAANIFEFIQLDKNSILYKEHISRLEQGELLWKYAERYYYIANTFISEDKNTKEIYINSSYVTEKNMKKSSYKIQHIPQITKRKYIKGITVKDYIKDKTNREKILIIDKLLNYIFSTYKAADNPQKVSGELFDCHLCNFLICEDGQFHFIDFDLKCTESLDRAFCVYFMLYKDYPGLYQKILKKYNLPDKHTYYEKNFSIYRQPLVQNGKSVISAEHKRLQRKYFGDEGITPQYKIRYRKVACE